MTTERLEHRRRVWTAVKAAWKLNPDLRLGQLLVVALKEIDGSKPRDLFYAEDSLLLDALEKLIVKSKKVDQRLDRKKK